MDDQHCQFTVAQAQLYWLQLAVVHQKDQSHFQVAVVQHEDVLSIQVMEPVLHVHLLPQQLQFIGHSQLLYQQVAILHQLVQEQVHIAVVQHEEVLSIQDSVQELQVHLDDQQTQLDEHAEFAFEQLTLVHQLYQVQLQVAVVQHVLVLFIQVIFQESQTQLLLQQLQFTGIGQDGLP